MILDGESITIIAGLVGALIYTNKILIDRIAIKLDEVKEEIIKMRVELSKLEARRK